MLNYRSKLEQYINYCNKKYHEYESNGSWVEKEAWFVRGHEANKKLNNAYAALG